MGDQQTQGTLKRYTTRFNNGYRMADDGEFMLAADAIREIERLSWLLSEYEPIRHYVEEFGPIADVCAGVKALVEKSERLEGELNKAQRDVRVTHNIYKELELANGRLEADNAQLREGAEVLRAQLNERVDSLERLEARVRDQQLRIEELEHQRDRLAEKVRELEAANVKLAATINLPLNECNRRVKEAEQERDRLLHRIDGMRHDGLDKVTLLAENSRLRGLIGAIPKNIINHLDYATEIDREPAKEALAALLRERRE